jgi:hypothetical protein
VIVKFQTKLVRWEFLKTPGLGGIGLVTVAAILLGVMSFVGCSRTPLEIQPYVPPSYYASINVYPDDLLKAYFHPNLGDVALADRNYKNLPVVFKDVRVDEIMLRDKDKEIFYISSVKCTPLRVGDISALNAGDSIDIVGINRGPWPAYPGWLSFTDCLFLPSGLVQFSLGGPAFAPAY